MGRCVQGERERERERGGGGRREGRRGREIKGNERLFFFRCNVVVTGQSLRWLLSMDHLNLSVMASEVIIFAL